MDYRVVVVVVDHQQSVLYSEIRLMGIPQSPNTIITTSSSTHMYSQALQVKLYQAFIFSIPILFSIILFLLFYLFYLKRRSSNLPPPSPPPILPRSLSHEGPFVSLPSEMGLKEELQEKLPKVIFDEDLKEKDSICCVCLGEFEMKEELVQMGLCKHLFHVECINHWLQSNATCPLCRSSVLSSPSHLPSKSLIITTQQQQLTAVPSTTLVEEAAAASSSSSTITTTSSSVTSRVSNENEMDQPFALHILVQNS